MVFSKRLLALLAIFCVIVSASAVCAADLGGYAGSNYQDMNGVSGSQYYVNNGNNLEPGAGLPLENQTGYVPLDSAGNPIAQTTNNATGHAAGNATAHAAGNATAHAAGNATAHAAVNTTTNSTNATAHTTMLPTGNPIIILLAVFGVVGGYAAIRRNK
jgi:hypothetical protein